MRKGIVILLAGAMAAMTLLGGCGKDTGDVSSSAESEGREVKAKELLKATDYDVTKYVTLMDDYMNLSVELDDEDLNTALSAYPIYVEGDKTTVAVGDVVNIDYEGTLDGEAFDGGTASGYNLTIGSGSFIDGFEDGLVGANVGDSLDLNLTFPEDYSSEDLAGQEVVFHVTVNAIMDTETATLDNIDDDYIYTNFYYYGFTTVDDFVSYYRQSETQTKVLEMLVEGCTVELPDGLLDERVEQVVTNVKSAAEEDGSEFEDYISTNYGYDTEEDFRTYVSDTLSDQLIQELILEAIVADQKTSINTADFDDFVAQYVSYYSYDSTDDFYEDYGGEDYVMLSYAENVAFQAVIDGADATVAESTDDAADETSATEE